MENMRAPIEIWLQHYNFFWNWVQNMGKHFYVRRSSIENKGNFFFTTRYFEYNNENVEKIFINSIGIKHLI